MEEFLIKLQPYLSLVTTLLSLAVLGFIINLALLLRQSYAARAEALIDQKGVIEERLKKSEKDLEKTEKWYQREIDRLKNQLSEILKKENITTEKLADPSSFTELKEEIKTVIKDLLKEMKSLETSVKNDGYEEVSDPKWYLDMANAFSASDRWLDAAKHYDKYILYNNEDWEIHFLRAVAYANSRIDNSTNISALRSYNDSIALIPTNLDNNTKARLYAYRGAILKRLGRLDESLNDLLFAKNYATARYEVNDIKYNLACVYAMKNDKDNLFQLIKELKASYNDLSAIRAHLNDYFSSFITDKEFMNLISK
jgi:hypothetical protein